VSNLAEITFFASLQAHQTAWFVTKKSTTSIEGHDQFELLKSYSDVGRQLCRHVGPYSSTIPLCW